MGTLFRLKILGLQKLGHLLDISQHCYVVYLTFPLSTAEREFGGVIFFGFVFYRGCKECIYFSAHCCISLNQVVHSILTLTKKLMIEELFDLFCLMQALWDSLETESNRKSLITFIFQIEDLCTAHCSHLLGQQIKKNLACVIFGRPCCPSI